MHYLCSDSNAVPADYNAVPTGIALTQYRLLPYCHRLELHHLHHQVVEIPLIPHDTFQVLIRNEKGEYISRQYCAKYRLCLAHCPLFRRSVLLADNNLVLIPCYTYQNKPSLYYLINWLVLMSLLNVWLTLKPGYNQPQLVVQILDNTTPHLAFLLL